MILDLQPSWHPSRLAFRERSKHSPRLTLTGLTIKLNTEARVQRKNMNWIWYVFFRRKESRMRKTIWNYKTHVVPTILRKTYFLLLLFFYYFIFLPLGSNTRRETVKFTAGKRQRDKRDIQPTFGMMGAWSFLCLKPSQLKPSNHLQTQMKCSRVAEISLIRRQTNQAQNEGQKVAWYLLVFHYVFKTSLLVAESLSGVLSVRMKWNVNVTSSVMSLFQYLANSTQHGECSWRGRSSLWMVWTTFWSIIYKSQRKESHRFRFSDYISLFQALI